MRGGYSGERGGRRVEEKKLGEDTRYENPLKELNSEVLG
jgi:hypothetical protein